MPGRVQQPLVGTAPSTVLQSRKDQQMQRALRLLAFPPQNCKKYGQLTPENHWVVQENRLRKVNNHAPCGSLPRCIKDIPVFLEAATSSFFLLLAMPFVAIAAFKPHPPSPTCLPSCSSCSALHRGIGQEVDTSAVSVNDTARLSESKLRCHLGGPKYRHEHHQVPRMGRERRRRRARVQNPKT